MAGGVLKIFMQRVEDGFSESLRDYDGAGFVPGGAVFIDVDTLYFGECFICLFLSNLLEGEFFVLAEDTLDWGYGKFFAYDEQARALFGGVKCSAGSCGFLSVNNFRGADNAGMRSEAFFGWVVLD